MDESVFKKNDIHKNGPQTKKDDELRGRNSMLFVFPCTHSASILNGKVQILGYEHLNDRNKNLQMLILPKGQNLILF